MRHLAGEWGQEVTRSPQTPGKSPIRARDHGSTHRIDRDREWIHWIKNDNLPELVHRPGLIQWESSPEDPTRFHASTDAMRRSETKLRHIDASLRVRPRTEAVTYLPEWSRPKSQPPANAGMILTSSPGRSSVS